MNVERRITELKKILSRAFERPLPGTISQFKLSPPFRDQYPAGKDKKDAAVLILIYPKQDTIFTVFIQRNNYNGPHSGQISFPGGKFDMNDKSLEETAIREANEEIGTTLTTEDISGKLTTLYIPVSKFEVSPYVSVIDYEPVFHIDPHEVQYAIEIPLKTIIKECRIESMNIAVANKPVAVPCFNLNNNQIWGATAMILNEFVEILKSESPDISSSL